MHKTIKPLAWGSFYRGKRLILHIFAQVLNKEFSQFLTLKVR